MKILICTGIYPPDIGGPATYSKLLFDELPKREIDVEVLSFGEVRYLPRILRHFFYFMKVLIKGRKVGLIYAQDPVSVGLPSVLASKILGKIFFIRIAGDYAWEQFQQNNFKKENIGIEEFQLNKYDFITEIRKKIERYVAKKSDQIIVPSYYFKSIIEKWNIDSEKIEVIYNGIDLNFKKIIKKEKKDKIILSVGRLVPWKGFKELIEMMPSFLEINPEIKLHIAGDGPQKDELVEIINKLNLNEKVFLLGKVDREELLNIKQSVDIFVFNTHWESFSFDTIECMLLDLPVITTKVGSLPELIENNKEGILVEPNNTEHFINAINKLLKDDDFRLNIIKNAKIKVQVFSIQNTLNKLEKLLKNKSIN